MKRRRVIYEGKAKILYEGTEPGTVIQYFKDDATAGNGAKKDTIEGKGVLNNRISEYLMTQLAGIGVPTHFVKRLNMREQLIKEVEIIPLEVVVRNVAAGSMSKRLGIEEGTALPRSIIEYYYKNDGLNDPWVSEEGMPIVGDPKYGVSARGVTRPLLHATELVFVHPRTSKEVRIASRPPWTLDELRALRKP